MCVYIYIYIHIYIYTYIYIYRERERYTHIMIKHSMLHYTITNHMRSGVSDTTIPPRVPPLLCARAAVCAGPLSPNAAWIRVRAPASMLLIIIISIIRCALICVSLVTCLLCFVVVLIMYVISC